MRVTVTRRLWGLIVLTALVYLGGMNSLVVWLYAVAAMLGSLLVIGVAGPFLALRAATVRPRGVHARGFDPPLGADAGLAFEGDRVRVELQATGLDVDRVLVGPLLCGGGVEVAVDGAGDGDQPERLRLEVAGCPRGRFPITGLRVTSSWPLGLVRVERTLALDLPLTVHARYACVAVPAGSARGAGTDDPARRGGGGDVVNLRPHQPTDSRRRIHWLTSARAGELMVVERAAPAAQGVHCSLGVEPGSSAAAVEAGVRLVASVAASCTAGRRPVRLSLGPGTAVTPSWAGIRAALAAYRPAPAAATAPGAAQPVDVTVRGESVLVRAGDTTLVVAADLGPEQLAATLAGLL